jgi:glutamate racemase
MVIGVFDSGVGGLGVLAAIRRRLPHVDLIYLGDTARVPYGSRSAETVRRYSLRVASHLWDQRIDALVIACNTATTHALPALQGAGHQLGLPVFGVVDPGVRAALDADADPRAIAILGTEGTVRGGAYQRAITARAPHVRVVAVACPLFVPLAEEGWTHGEVPRLVAEQYVGSLRGEVDTAILGCTHYPLLRDVLAETLPGTRLVDSAEATADAVVAHLGHVGGDGRTRYQVTDHVERFVRVGERFLGAPPDGVEWVDIPEARGAWADPAEIDDLATEEIARRP